jgi:hypothetical protein
MSEPLPTITFTFAPKYAMSALRVAGYDGPYIVLYEGNVVVFVHSYTGLVTVVGLAQTFDAGGMFSRPYPGIFRTSADKYGFIEGVPVVGPGYVLTRAEPREGWHKGDGTPAQGLQIIRDRAYAGQVDLTWLPYGGNSITGDRGYLVQTRGPFDPATYVEVDLTNRTVLRAAIPGVPPVSPGQQTSINGVTYTVATEGQFNSTSNTQSFRLAAIGVATEPAPPPVVVPPPVVTPPPTTPTVEQRVAALEARMHAVDGK